MAGARKRRVGGDMVCWQDFFFGDSVEANEQERSSDGL